MEENKKKLDTKAILEQAKKAKALQANNKFIKKSGSKRDKDECRRVNFNR